MRGIGELSKCYCVICFVALYCIVLLNAVIILDFITVIVDEATWLRRLVWIIVYLVRRIRWKIAVVWEK